jgi:hypothetical protein
MRKLRKIDFVSLLDKVGGKLPGWKGKLMTKAARAQLVNSVLTVVVTYHATVLPLPKWLIRKIDKLRQNFFWKGEDGPGNKRGNLPYKVELSMQAKRAGGVWVFTTSTVLVERFTSSGSGIAGPMIQNHGRGLTLPCNEHDRALFQASTKIKLGNRKKAAF